MMQQKQKQQRPIAQRPQSQAKAHGVEQLISMTDMEELKKMVMSLQVKHLQILLSATQQMNKTGNKKKLQLRILGRLKTETDPGFRSLIRQLYQQKKKAPEAAVGAAGNSSRAAPAQLHAIAECPPVVEKRRRGRPARAAVAAAVETPHRLRGRPRKLAPKVPTTSSATMTASASTWTPASTSSLITASASASFASLPAPRPQPGRKSGLPSTTSVGPQVAPAPRVAARDPDHTLASYLRAKLKSNQVLSYMLPILSDVAFKPLPFYDTLGVLLSPATIVPTKIVRGLNHNTVSFSMTPAQVCQVSNVLRIVHPLNKVENVVQIQMRFCLMETTSLQEDNFPPNLIVKVNNKLCPLPPLLPSDKIGLNPKRLPKPLDITSLCHLSPQVVNKISIAWTSEAGRQYVVGIYIVKQLSPYQLLQRMKARGIRNSEYTKAMIIEKLSPEADSEIATTSLRGSLLCPLGKTRMSVPCRSTTCSHIQCFDASLYLQMNERKPSWICPVCDKHAAYDNLSIDGLFTEILSLAPTSSNEIEFQKDGLWSAIQVKKDRIDGGTIGENPTTGGLLVEDVDMKREKAEKGMGTTHGSVQLITLDDDDEEEEEEGNKSPEIVSDSDSRLTTPSTLTQSSSTSSPAHPVQANPYDGLKPDNLLTQTFPDFDGTYSPEYDIYLNDSPLEGEMFFPPSGQPQNEGQQHDDPEVISLE